MPKIEPKKRSTDRQKLYTLLSALYIALVLATVLLINILISRFPAALDLGGGLSRTLRPETLKLLSGLTEEVEIIAFLPEGVAAERARSLFSELQAASENIHARVIDPEADPGAVRDAKLGEGERVRIRAGGRESQLPTAEEIPLAQALARVTATKRRDVCFSIEHDERAVNDTEPGGLARAAKLLEDEGFAVREAPLSRVASLEGCRVVVVAGAQHPISALQQQSLLQYSSRGGGLLLLSESGYADGLSPLLLALGMDSAGVLEDPEARDPRAVSARTAKEHPATASLLAAGQLAYLYGPFAFYPRGATEPLLFASSSTQTRESEALGPYPVALVLERRPGRVIAISDAEFATNSRLSNGGNREFWLSIIDWLTEPEIPTGPPALTDSQKRNAAIFAEAILPGIFALIGVYAWRQRRLRKS